MGQKEKSLRGFFKNTFVQKLISLIFALIFGILAIYVIVGALPDFYYYLQTGCAFNATSLGLFFYGSPIILPLLIWGCYSLFVNTFVKKSNLKNKGIVVLICLIIIAICLFDYNLPGTRCPVIN